MALGIVRFSQRLHFVAHALIRVLWYDVTTQPVYVLVLVYIPCAEYEDAVRNIRGGTNRSVLFLIILNSEPVAQQSCRNLFFRMLLRASGTGVSAKFNRNIWG